MQCILVSVKIRNYQKNTSDWPKYHNVNPEFYKNLYFDLRNIEDDKLIEHFNKFGIYEGRIASQNMLEKRIEKNMRNLVSKLSLIIIVILLRGNGKNIRYITLR